MHVVVLSRTGEAQRGFWEVRAGIQLEWTLSDMSSDETSKESYDWIAHSGIGASVGDLAAEDER